MRILTAVMNPIGFDGRVQRASRALSALGDVTLVCPSGGPAPVSPSYEVVEIDLPQGFGSRFTEHLYFWFALQRIAARMAPDLIYVHDCYLAPIGRWMAWRHRTPLVYDAHELAIPWDDGEMRWQDHLKYRFDAVGVRAADLVIAARPERAQLMAEHYDLPAVPLVIGNFAELDSSSPDEREPADLPEQLREGDHECLYLYQGHVAEERELSRFVEAMKFLPDSHCLLVVGGGPDVEYLQDLSAKLGVSRRVFFTGRVSRDAVGALMRRSDIGLLSYSWNGPNNIYCTPNKVFEYAIAGLPMVATEQPPIREYFSGSEIGYLIPKGAEPSVVARTMQRAFEDRKRLKENIPAFQEKYSWAGEERRLVAAISKLVDEEPLS